MLKMFQIERKKIVFQVLPKLIFGKMELVQNVQVQICLTEIFYLQ